MGYLFFPDSSGIIEQAQYKSGERFTTGVYITFYFLFNSIKTLF